MNTWDVPEKVPKEKAAIQQRGQLGAQASSHDLSVGHSGDFPKYPVLVLLWDESNRNTHMHTDELSICVIVCRFWKCK